MSDDLPFTFFNRPVEQIVLPNSFTFPFYYQPHNITLMAIEQLQHELLNNPVLANHFFHEEQCAAGKMFGVLVVKNKQGELGYLSAFSGKLNLESLSQSRPENISKHLENSGQQVSFVPSIAESIEANQEFIDKNLEINELNKALNELMIELKIETLQAKYRELTQQFNNNIENFRQRIIENRKVRKEKRLYAKEHLLELDADALLKQLAKESVAEKNELNAFKESQSHVLSLAKNTLHLAEEKVEKLKRQRKTLSTDLQQAIFEQYSFLNALGETKNVIELFSKPLLEKTPEEQNVTEQFNTIPSGAGDCAAPKLLNYAYQHQYQPIAMAEFWWGKSPKSAIRKHQQIYPACHSKCQPILTHMLKGLNVDENPLLMNPAEGKQLDIIYQDDDILVINKPANFLSVPGKNITDSVYSRIRLAFPYATGPLIVHRLDMSTSGLMVLALTKDANKQLQKQFIKRTVAKRYVAVLSGVLVNDKGDVDLPLRVDLDDRPRQLVCYSYGKAAQTSYEVISTDENSTRVYFYPKTGRTHQLRVHSAHHLGLNAPIIGDDHYGSPAKRLHLHAEQLMFTHPASGKKMSFEVTPDF